MTKISTTTSHKKYPNSQNFFCLFFSFFGVTSLMFMLSPLSLAAEDNGTASQNSSVSLSVQEIISLRLLDSTASSEISQVYFDMTPTPNGVFEKKSFFAEAATSNPTGYKLYLTSSGKNHSGNYTNALINTDPSLVEETSTVPSLTTNSSITEADFRKTNSDYKNRWGYSTNSLNVQSETVDGATTNTITENTSDITYSDVPENSVNRQIDNKREATDHGLTPVTVGINVSSGLASGVYMNTLELTAIASPLELDFSLNFDENTSDTVTGLPEALTESSVASQVNFTIPSSTPTRDGYAFVEWNTKADGSGDSYNPGNTFTILADDGDESGTSKTLYAVWEEAKYKYSISYTCRNSSTNCPKSETIIAREKTLRYTIPQDVPLKTGYTLMGYSTDSHYDYNNYKPGDTITITYGSYLIGEGTPNEFNNTNLYATWSSTFTMGGLTWTGPVVRYSTYDDAASYCPKGYRLPTIKEIENVIGPMADASPYTVGTNTSNMAILYNRWYTNSSVLRAWTSTPESSSRMYTIYLGYSKYPDKILIDHQLKTSKITSVICVK